MPATASSDKATAVIEELTEALKNPSEAAKPFLDTGNKLNEAIAALTGYLLWRQYWRHFWGSFFYGEYLPQKLDL
jgi:hypothetical protein